jgi:hypothetical protein
LYIFLSRAVTTDLKHGRQRYGPCRLRPPCDLTAQNNALLIVDHTFFSFLLFISRMNLHKTQIIHMHGVVLCWVCRCIFQLVFSSSITSSTSFSGCWPNVKGCEFSMFISIHAFYLVVKYHLLVMIFLEKNKVLGVEPNRVLNILEGI